jgi:indole-3-glycerol phosphate synthase
MTDENKPDEDPSQLAKQVADMLASDFAKVTPNVPEYKRKSNSLDVTAMMMDEDEEDYSAHVDAEYIAPEEDSFEPLDELSASLTKDQLSYVSQQNYGEIRQTSEISYLDSGYTSAPVVPKENKPLATGDNVLEQICEKKREHILRQRGIVFESRLREMVYTVPTPRGFYNAINAKVAAGKNALIAEIKKASPSKGVIRPDFEVGVIARCYEEGGATCISVLTDNPYFQGRDEYISIARRASSLPVLRKDFILDPYQVLESRALGADCILLIMAALNDSDAQKLENEAMALGMDVLVEVHDEEELERAVKLKTNLIGINNRNLKTLQVDISTTEKLASYVPKTKIVICESGIYTYQDIQRMNRSEVRTFLVGESLMVQADVKAAVVNLMGG